MIESEKLPGKKRATDHTAKSLKMQRHSKAFWRNNNLVPSPGKYNLTICDTHKFIWFRNAKVGTRTTFAALDEAGIELTAESLYGCHYFPQFYADYFKFAFVRNPWDRFVSGWINKVLAKNTFDLDPEIYNDLKIFDNFVDYCSKLDLKSWNAHFRHQCKLIDLNEVDFIGRLEHFDHDIAEVFNKLNIPLIKVPNKNQSATRKHYSAYYSDHSRRMIGEMYRKDIQLFGYEFEEQQV